MIVKRIGPERWLPIISEQQVGGEDERRALTFALSLRSDGMERVSLQ